MSAHSLPPTPHGSQSLAPSASLPPLLAEAFGIARGHATRRPSAAHVRALVHAAEDLAAVLDGLLTASRRVLAGSQRHRRACPCGPCELRAALARVESA